MKEIVLLKNLLAIKKSYHEQKKAIAELKEKEKYYNEYTYSENKHIQKM